MIITVDVYANLHAAQDVLTELEVKCVAKAGTNILTIDRVKFHDLTDAQYQAIVDAIEMYLLRKRQREVTARAAGGPTVTEPGVPE